MLAPTPYRNDHVIRRIRMFAALTLAALLVTLLPLVLRGPAAPAPTTTLRPAGLPLIVTPSGDSALPFSAFGLSTGIAFAPDGVRLELGGERLAVRFVAPQATVALAPLEQRTGTISRYIGERSTWREQLPTYAAIGYQGLYPGVDLRYDGVNGDLKGTYVIAPHADPAAIRWRYEGAERVALDPTSGDLLINLPGGGTLREAAPIAWQDLPAGRVAVAAHFTLADGVASFQLGAYDPAQPLVIDPTLTLGTYLGGGSADYGRGIAVDSAGAIYLVGDYFSSDFLGSATTPSGSTDVIVLKLSPDGNELVHGTVIGGTGTDEGLAITVNAAGEAFVLVDPGGDFPLPNAALGTTPEVGDGILMKFSTAGELQYSTYLGFNLSNLYTGKAIAVGPNGNLYVTGQSYIAERRLAQLALVEVNSASGAVVRSFDRGGRYITTDGAAVAVGPGGRVYLTGTVGYPFGEFPTTANAVQRQCGAKLLLGAGKDCGENAFLMVFSPTFQVEYASYLGGSGSDEGRGLAVDRQGNAIIVGNATSEDFPVTNALQPSCPSDPSIKRCSYDGFITKLSPTAGFIYSTYLTAPSQPEGQTFINEVVVDAAGNALVAGFSNAAGLPLKDELQPLGQGEVCGALNRFCFDAYVVGLAADGSLRFGSYLGGKFDEYTQDIAVDVAGAIYLIGYSDGSGFPTTSGSIQPTKRAGHDFFVAKIALGGGSTPAPEPRPELKYKAYLPLVKR